MCTPRAKHRVRNGATAGTNMAYEAAVLCAVNGSLTH